MSSQQSSRISATIDLADEAFASSGISSDGHHIEIDLPAIQRIIRDRDRAANQPPRSFTKVRVEIKSKSHISWHEGDIGDIRDSIEGDEPEYNPVLGGQSKEVPKQNINTIEERIRAGKINYGWDAAPDHTPDPRTLIATVAVPESPGQQKTGWIVVEGQWLFNAKVCTYQVPTEWKVTQLVGMDYTRLAVLGRNGCGKTIVEIYQLITPFEKLFEKVFNYGQKDVWQFGADGGGNSLILGCQNELGKLDIDNRSYEAVQINRRVKNWGSKRVRALCCGSGKILIANDRDLTIQVFTMTFTVSSTVTIQDHIDCIWSLALYNDQIFVCGGIAGEAFAMDWQGKMLFNFRPPEAQAAAVPAVVKTDCDGFTHVFWMVKTDASFRAVDFYYNVQNDNCFGEVRLDKKVKYMTCVKRSPPPDLMMKTMDARTVVMTDEGDLYVCDTIFEDSRGI